MKRAQSLKTTLFTLAFICFAAVSVTAQVLPTALTGRVVDTEGVGIQNAVVMVKTGDNLLAHTRTLTDAQGNFGQAGSPPWRNAAIHVADGGQPVLIVRKAGYLPNITPSAALAGNAAGTITLTRDPIENRIDSIIALMSTANKIAQMTQPHLSTPTSNWGGNSTSHNSTSLFGSVLNGGDGYSSTFLGEMANNLNSWPANRGPKIPTYYGKDAVHGNAGIPGYTVFPHNIGLGATRDSALVRRIGEATAKEMWAAGIDLNFSPAISVARDARWGRTYESYGETAYLSVQMGAAMVRGLQGDRFDAPWRVTATAKHFLADGGTAGGVDRGNSVETDEELRMIHLPGYEAVVEQGVLSIMASFNTIRGVHQHVDSLRMTGWLKTELGFDGYIISDWLGITNSENHGYTGDDYGFGGTPPPSIEAVRDAINAGIDLAMEPGTHVAFMEHLTALVNNGGVSMDRIDDAVRRILRAKFRAGRMDNFSGPSEFVGNTANRASAAHRAIAREAVAKSQVLLKNEDDLLPLAKNASIHVFGSHRDDIGRQCGGWTITWRGVRGNSGSIGGGFGNPSIPFDFTTHGASIYQGMQQVAPQANLSESPAGITTGADIIVYVTGEEPYAEWHGDIESLNFSPSANDMATLANYRSQGKKVVTIFVTGRPRIVPELIDASDAFLVAWLPGTEGGGVADVLFGEQPFTGRLPFTWPGSSGTTQFPYGFGMPNNTSSIASNDRVIPPADTNRDNRNEASGVTINEFTVGPNPADRAGGSVNFFWQGVGIRNTTLSIYDASGNFIRRISVSDRAFDGSADDRRQVGSWDFTDSRGRPVSRGSYVVKGNITAQNGKKERVSVVVGVN
ncbi:MAG: glycoside hydrolase family 3 C-terminal domain-containing protein [Chitinispirillales bacterium]|jgi:beta-glucosidase|nr:glycoside hydrolase family 3 C-terminal domain-containing protein [Chitinispirillales bacterium]